MVTRSTTPPLLSPGEFDVLLGALNLEENGMNETPETPENLKNCQDFSNFVHGSTDASTEPKTPNFEDVILGSRFDKIQASPGDLEVTPTGRKSKNSPVKLSDHDLAQQMNRYYAAFSEILNKSDDTLMQLTADEWSALKLEFDLFYQYLLVITPDDHKYQKLFEEIQLRLTSPPFANYWT